MKLGFISWKNKKAITVMQKQTREKQKSNKSNATTKQAKCNETELVLHKLNKTSAATK